MNEPVLYGAQVKLPDTFAMMASPSMNFAVSQEEYQKQTGIIKDSATKYWDMVDNTRNAYAEQLSSIMPGNTLSQFTHTDDNINKIWHNKDAWTAFDKVINHGGHIMAFDTETIGRFSVDSNASEHIAAGITEIGFDVKTFKGSNAKPLKSLPKASFFFGIDDYQHDYLMDLADKFSKGEKLTGGEISDLERASRHSTIPVDGHSFKISRKVWNREVYTFVDSLNVSRPNDLNAIYSGIENMHALYTPDRDNQISKVVNYINSFVDNKIAPKQEKAIVGQNLAYDIDFINNYAVEHNTAKLNDFQYADTMQGLKAKAEYNYTTTGDIIKKINPEVSSKRLASEEALTEAVFGDTEFASKLAHNAYNDSSNLLNNIITNEKLNYSEVSDIISNISKDTEPNVYNLQESFIKINKGGFDRRSDILLIDGIQTSSGYNPANMTWEYQGDFTASLERIKALNSNNETIELIPDSIAENIRKNKNNPREISTDKFVVKLKATNWRDDVDKTMYKVFDNEQSARRWFSNNTTLISHYSDVMNQEWVHDIDIARRVIEGFTDSGNVSIDNKSVENGGYNAFKKYYDLYKELSSLSEEQIKEISIDNIEIDKNLKNLIGAAKDKDYLPKTREFFMPTERKRQKSVEQLFADNYKEGNIIDQVFTMFRSNEEFFKFADEQLSSFEGSNLQKTFALKKMKESYLRNGDLTNDSFRRFGEITESDINTVAVRINKKSDTLLDISSPEKAAGRLEKAVSYSAGNGTVPTDKEKVTRLLNVAKDLQERELLTKSDLYGTGGLLKTYGGLEQPYELSKSITQKLHNNLYGVTQLTPNRYANILDEYENGISIREISANNDVLERDVRLIISKSDKTLLERATADMMLVESNGPLTKEFIDESNAIISKTKNNIISMDVKGENKWAFKKQEAQLFNDVFSEMGYSQEDIKAFTNIFHASKDQKTKANFAKINQNLENNKKEQVQRLLYKSQKENSSAFMFFTTPKNYAKLYTALSELNPEANNTEVKEAIKGLASYYEIHNLEKIDVSNGTKADEIIEQLTGHKAQTVLVSQGDNYSRYSTLSLNIYRDSQTGELKGGIKDQGGEYITNIRRRFNQAMEAISEGNYDSATRLLNNANIAELQEASAPQYGGRIVDGKLVKSHIMTQKDISAAHAIRLEHADQSDIGMSDYIKEILNIGTEEEAKLANKDSYKALRGIYEAFDQKYEKAIPYKNGVKYVDNRNINRVLGDSNFRIFYTRYLTDSSGGIGSEKLIKEFISQKDNVYAEALAKYSNGSLMNIVSDLSQDLANIGKVDKDLADTIKLLSTHGFLNSDTSQSMAKHGLYYMAYDTYENTNGRYTAFIRPTHSQRENYRPFYLDKNDFYNIDEMESKFGIYFGDLIAPENFVNNVAREDAKNIKRATGAEKAASELSRYDISQRNIIGAVQSINESELSQNLENFANNISEIAKKENLDEDALRKVYTRMVDSFNTYEGKAYVRPELANQPFFTRMDPKTIKSNKLKDSYASGTEEARKRTEEKINSYIGKTVNNGDVIGYSSRINAKGEEIFIPIKHNGPAIDSLTRQNADELLNYGKTQAVVTKQVEDIKIMVGDEKATAESLVYTKSISHADQIRDTQTLLKEFGLSYTDNLEENISKLNKYTNVVYDYGTGNFGNHRTMVVLNNNISKHLTDMSFESQLDVIGMEFKGKEGFESLKALIGKDIKINVGTEEKPVLESLVDHLDFKNGVITYDTKFSYARGAQNAFDQIIDKMSEATDNELAQRVVNDLKYMRENNIAFMPIQRQQMNTFQGQNFKMDQRFYQGMVMQGEGNYLEGSGAKLAETIRSRIENGYYDKIENIGTLAWENYSGNIIKTKNAFTETWANMVRDRRGTLQPKSASDMILGIHDALHYMQDDVNVNELNIIKIKADEILHNIPKSGTNNEGYRDFIFKVDNELTPFLEARRGGVIGNNINSIFIDLSEFGNLKYTGSLYTDETGKAIEKELKGIILPIQHINTIEDEMYVGNSTRNTIGFLNTLNSLTEKETAEGITIRRTEKEMSDVISEAIDNLFDAYSKELDIADKESLATKAYLKFAMPNSSGLLAKDAVTPHADFIDYKSIRTTENQIIDLINKGYSTNAFTDKIEELATKYTERSNTIIKQIENINKKASAGEDIVKNLHFSNNELYNNYIRSFDENGKLIFKDGKQVLESAVLVSKDMLRETQMDPGIVGYEVAYDYFRNGKPGLKAYDSFSRATLKDFSISSQELQDVTNKLFEAFEGENKEFKKFGKFLKQGIDSIYNNTTLSQEARDSKIISEITKSIDIFTEDLKKSGKKELAEKFINEVNGAFEGIGERYYKEVGVFGLTGRFPFFNETGILPIRVYLDDTIQGKQGRFLGPQFSILQNLDFDGDTEFIKFLGNGGLLAKNNAEYILHKQQFDYMNTKNFDIFKESLLDSIKEYRYGDQTYYKGDLLSSLDKDLYKRAEADYISSLNDLNKKLLLNESGELNETGTFIFRHSKQIKNAFSKLDIKFGTTMNMEDMMKAAIQANIMKEFIGDFSKPNLEVRNALTYMLSLAEGEDEKKLLGIKDLLFSIDSESEHTRKINTLFQDITDKRHMKTTPGGLLTMLEQKGIDTKHVKDASSIQNTNAWREGIAALFLNSNGAKERNTDLMDKSVNKLVEGASKVFFGATDDNTEILRIANEIINAKDYNVFIDRITKEMTEDAISENIGKAYIRGLYEMANMQNAYDGFFSDYRKVSLSNATNYYNIEESLEETLQAIKKDYGKRFDFDYLAKMSIYKSAIKNGTDERLMINHRALNANDILVYDTKQGPQAWVVDSVKYNDKRRLYDLTLESYDEIFDTNAKNAKKYRHIQGMSIKELNEKIKNGDTLFHNSMAYDGNLRLIDFTQLDNVDKNVSLNYLSRITKEEKSALYAGINQRFVSNKLQDLFEADANNFSNIFNDAINSFSVIKKYDSAHVGNLLKDVLGTDAEVFRQKIDTINSYLKYGIEKGYITQFNDSKELIKSINEQIASNPRKNIKRFEGNGAELLLNYTEGIVNLNSNKSNNFWITKDIGKVEEFNNIQETINNAIEERNRNIKQYGEKFYKGVVEENLNEDALFKDIRSSFETEIEKANKTIFEAFQKTSNPKQTMFESFGWDKISNKDFIISNVNDTMNLGYGNARVGYGRFAGTKLQDINKEMRTYILDEIDDELLNSLKKNNELQYIAANNTRELVLGLKATSLDSGIRNLDFTNKETLKQSYKAINTTNTSDDFMDYIKQAMREAAEETAQENVKKKTLLSNAKEAFKNMKPETKSNLKIGATAVAGISALGILGHALFTNDSNDNVEVPSSVEENIKNSTGRLSNDNIVINNKNGNEYRDVDSEAKQTKKMRKRKLMSAPKPKQNRRIYHDAGSGFNFKVSAQSYNKLQENSLKSVMQSAGIENGSFNISKDNSKITDNWLANKFADLTE